MEQFKRKHNYYGLLVVREGTDGSGKSTQLELLKKSLQDQCYGVMVSEWKTSRLIANVIDDAKERNLDVSWYNAKAVSNKAGIRLINTLGPGRYDYNPKAASTVAGILNSAQDLIYHEQLLKSTVLYYTLTREGSKYENT